MRVWRGAPAHSAKARVAPETLIRLMRPPSSNMKRIMLTLSRLSAPSTQKILEHGVQHVLQGFEGENWLSSRLPATMPTPSDTRTRRVMIAQGDGQQGGTRRTNRRSA